MYKILFVCHGNICRSPMAEFIFLDMLKKRGISGVTAASAATSAEEIGNPVHYGTAAVLRRLGIDYSDKRARQMTRRDAEDYDLLIGMDGANIRNMTLIAGEKYSGKIRLLLDFTDRPGAISDPWYTGDFDSTYRDVCDGCEGLIRWLIQENIVENS
ncbi:MAG: low molecular weight phosphotyrosine protein phosphatase [Oscillospiraceae bacterium]|nr:low molecular weight phosphotyrosine protein phosphatase [Oscillospiraceae bacterium]